MEDDTGLTNVSAALRQIDDQLHALRAETLVTDLLARHAIGILVRRSNEPMKVLEQLRLTTLEKINNIHFDGSNLPTDLIRSKARELHSTFFSELGSAN